MTDCHDTDIRERLPALAAEALTDEERARVRAHVAACAACAAELRVIGALRQLAVEPPTVDPRRIAAAVRRAHPRVAHGAGSDAGPSPVVRSAPVVPSGARWRVVGARAAAALLLAVGAAAVLRQPGAPGAGASPGRDTVLAAADAADRARVSVSYGDLGDYSAEELEVVLARLDRWDGEPSAEPMGALPLMPASWENER